MTEKRSPIQVRLHRSESWLKRAKSIPNNPAGKDLDGQFIFYWIAFNALYGQPRYLPEIRKPGTGEDGDIRGFLELLQKKDRGGAIKERKKEIENSWNEILNDDYLDKECWIAWHKANLVTLKERDRRPSQNRGSGLVDGFMRLYTLRNQLFHGGSTDQGSKNRDSLIRGVEVLEALIPVFVKVVRENSDDHELRKLLGPLPYPPTVGGVG